MTDTIQTRIAALERDLQSLKAELRIPSVIRGSSPRPVISKAGKTATNEKQHFLNQRSVKRLNGANAKSNLCKSHELPPLKRGPELKLYRLEIRTYQHGHGGTSADAYFNFVGANESQIGTGWIYCDNPYATVHQPGDIDYYYFYNAEIATPIQHQLVLEANRQRELDHWRWEGRLWTLTDRKWIEVYHIPETDSPANGNLRQDTFRNTGAAHLNGRTGQWTVWKSLGIEFLEVPNFTPNESLSTLKLANG